MGRKETEFNCYTYEEYINGETLAEILGNGPISDEKAVHWIRQLCEAVRFLHEQSSIIIHRDIKPSNIMLSFDGIIKLIDFDASKEFTPNQQRDTELIGTPNYAAPEQYGFAASDPRTDIYAVGILLHELITGYKPNEINAPYEGRYKKIIQKCISDFIFEPTWYINKVWLSTKCIISQIYTSIIKSYFIRRRKYMIYCHILFTHPVNPCCCT